MKKIMALLAIGLALPVQADVIEVHLYPKYIHQPDQHILVQNGKITAESQAVAQSNMVIYLEDKNGISVGIVVALFDPRPSYEEFVANDTYTAFASAPLLDEQSYISKSPYSHGYSSQPFADAMFTRVHFTRQNLENIIKDVNAQGLLLDEDMAGYKLHSGLWQTEIGGYSTTDNVSIGTSISHMVVLSCTGLQC